MEFSYVGHSDQGTVKNVNEDNYLVLKGSFENENICMAAVCDGVGMSNGAEASSFVVRRLEEWFKAFLSGRINPTHVLEQLKQFIMIINQELYERGLREQRSYGTTVSVIFFYNGKNYIVHVGDTRIYKFDKQLWCLTMDQTLQALKLHNGQMTEEEYETSKEKHVLLQCLGGSKEIEVQSISGSYRSNDIYFLSSDGQYRLLNKGEIEDILEVMQESSMGEIDSIVLDLIDAVKERREQDNITSVIVKVG